MRQDIAGQEVGRSGTARRPEHDDRAELVRYHESRDPRLREELIERYMPLARALAGRYSAGWEPYEDLLQVACEGLIKAVDRFDPGRSVSFTSYATPFILGTLKHHFRDNARAMRIPRGLQEEISRMRTLARDLQARNGREPTVEEVARESGRSVEEVLDALAAERQRIPISLDGAVREGDDEPQTLAETIPSLELGFDAAEARLAAAGVELDDGERLILRLRFEDGLTQREIGLRIGVAQMQVSRLLRRMLSKLLAAVQGETDETPHRLSA
jgi:RNA polymerase sigma-B factor